LKWQFLTGVVVLLVAAFGTLYWGWEGWLERSQDGVIRAAARKYGVEPSLVKAIVWRESRFNPAARGRAGEFGLMQVREEPALEWAEAEHLLSFDHQQCLDPATNTLAGTWYLRRLLKRYARTDNPLPYALADYNAGRGNVLKWTKGQAATNSAQFVRQIGFPSTRLYVQQVTARYYHYRLIFR
jgi:soluble lytic murein transglycosylase